MFVRTFLAFVTLLSLTAAAQAISRPALVFDMDRSLVLYAEDADKPWHPASLTKIMTAYIVYEEIKRGRIKLTDKLTTSQEARKQSSIGLRLGKGKSITVEDALTVMMVKSANDVAVMLAEKVSGTHANFARKMTLTAHRLGMKNTRFVNANGLPDARQVTTARDMAILARAILQEYPQYKNIYRQYEFKIGKRIVRSHNRLLKTFEGADGLKTGFICASGFNVVASATRDGQQIIAVVLGARTAGKRTVRAAKLLQHGFESYDWKALFGAENIDNMPRETFRVGPPNLRSKLRACGGGPRRNVKKKKKKKSKKKKKAETIDQQKTTVKKAATSPIVSPKRLIAQRLTKKMFQNGTKKLASNLLV